MQVAAVALAPDGQTRRHLSTKSMHSPNELETDGARDQDIFFSQTKAQSLDDSVSIWAWRRGAIDRGNQKASEGT